MLISYFSKQGGYARNEATQEVYVFLGGWVIKNYSDYEKLASGG